MTMPTNEPGLWTHGALPTNVRLGPGSVITGEHAFRRFQSRRDPAIVVGSNSTLHAPHLALGPDARLVIGDWCLLSAAMLLGEEEIRIGSYVAIGWNAAIADTDFHPIDAAQRQEDAVACSPLGGGRARPRALRRPVVIGDDVWIGPCATILKGVTIGAGAVIEPGALITRDVPPGAHVSGNPAQIIGEV